MVASANLASTRPLTLTRTFCPVRRLDPPIEPAR